MLSILLSFGVKHAQGIFAYFSSIAQSKSLKCSPFGSTGSVKYLVPTQLSSTTTVAPTDSAILCTFQLGTAIGDPEIISLGASFAATPYAMFLAWSSSSQSSLTFAVNRFTSSMKPIWLINKPSKPLIGEGEAARKSERRLRAALLAFMSSMASLSFVGLSRCQ